MPGPGVLVVCLGVFARAFFVGCARTVAMLISVVLVLFRGSDMLHQPAPQILVPVGRSPEIRVARPPGIAVV